jgi:beta-glucosidase
MKKIPVVIGFFCLPVFLLAQVSPKAKEIVSKMTLEEKIKLVIGMGFKMPEMPNPPSQNKKDSAKDVLGIGLPPVDAEDARIPEKVPGAAGRSHAIARLGIPTLTLSDGPAGVRIEPKRKSSNKTYYATAWPVGTLLASSWDTVLVKKVGIAFGNEIKEYGVDVILAPALNIHRNPLGGRNFEYYSEDPVVAGNIAAAIVNGIESNGVGTSIKHFAANNQETNRNSVNTIVSERALREIYLKGFEIAVKKSQPWTVMSSYNYINGTYTSESRDLLTDILRKEWGFKGLVMTDWFGGKDAVAQMKAGNDLLMPGTIAQSKSLTEAVKNGKLDEKILTENCERIINIVLMSPTYQGYKYSDQPDLKAHAQVSRSAASEGMVLLKNENVLPLHQKNVALFGNISYSFIAGGTGSGDVNKAYTVSLLDGLKNGGYVVNEDLKKAYTDYITVEKSKQRKPAHFFDVIPPIAEFTVTEQLAQQQAISTDIAIITIGRNAGEGADRKVDNDFNLSSTEQELIKTITAAYHANHKKVIVVLNIGGVIETASWKSEVDAILLAWQPGIEAGNAVTDVINGKINPSGKLATTFPVNYSDVPSARNFPGRELDPSVPANPLMGKPAEVIYEEGIYVGYRYYNTFNVKPSYEFGYGLSYTNFRYSNVKLSASHFNNKITASITVTNSGKAAGKEVAQLYIAAPGKTLNKPAEELKGFAKTKLLKPGESETIVFTITAKDLASYDTKAAAWMAEAGTYTVKIGASSANIKSTATFTVAKEIITEKVTNLLVPKATINELTK